MTAERILEHARLTVAGAVVGAAFFAVLAPMLGADGDALSWAGAAIGAATSGVLVRKAVWARVPDA